MSITDPRTYEIQQDREGFYIATDDGWDLMPRHRCGSYREAEAKLAGWIAEDEDARAQEKQEQE